VHQRDVKITLVDADTYKVGGFASAVVVDEDVEGLVLRQESGHVRLNRVCLALDPLRLHCDVNAIACPVERTESLARVGRQLRPWCQEPIIPGHHSISR